jgi:CheY-like chemotaxis protein
MPENKSDLGPGRASLRVLCTENDPILGDILVVAFEVTGHKAEFVSSGPATLSRLTQAQSGFDTLLTKHDMAGFSGLELVKLCRGSGIMLPVVVHGDLLKAGDIRAYRTLGVDHFVPEVCELSELVSTVEQAVLSHKMKLSGGIQQPPNPVLPAAPAPS